MLPLVASLDRLFEQELYESCVVLCDTQLKTESLTNSDKEYFQLKLADSLFMLEEYQRSFYFYGFCIDNVANNIGNISECINSLILFGKCCLKLNELTRARQIFELLSENRLSIPLLRVIVQVYVKLGDSSNIVKYAHMILTQEPDAIEYYRLLLKYQVKIIDMNHLISSSQLGVILYMLKIDEMVVNNQASSIIADPKYASLEQAQQLLFKLSNNDPFCLENVDLAIEYLSLKQFDLDRFVDAYADCCPSRPESWNILSYSFQRRKKFDQALTISDKAISLDSHHFMSYIRKGNIHAELNSRKDALEMYIKAFSVTKNIFTFEALCQAYVATEKYHLATNLAYDVLKTIPKSTRSLALIGMVLSTNTDTLQQGQLAYENAIKLNPQYLPAILGLADCYAVEENYKAAIKLLENAATMGNTDAIYTKMGELHFLDSNADKARDNFLFALKLNPTNIEARQGLDAIDRRQNEEMEM